MKHLPHFNVRRHNIDFETCEFKLHCSYTDEHSNLASLRVTIVYDGDGIKYVIDGNSEYERIVVAILTATDADSAYTEAIKIADYVTMYDVHNIRSKLGKWIDHLRAMLSTPLPY